MSVKEFEERCFEGTNVVKVKIPKNTEVLGQYAFSGCKELVQVIFEQGHKIKGLLEGTFYECSALNEIALPEQMSSIPKHCFFGAGVIAIVVPGAVEIIQQSACEKCGRLETVTFEQDSRLKEIESRAFSACRKLKNINLPAGL